MRTAGIIAVAVFRESVRDKVFYNLALFAVLLIGASILIGQLTAGQDVKIIKDLGLAATSLFGLFVAISSASAWCRRKSIAAACTRCSPSRSGARSSSRGNTPGSC
jgi:heme A synthase